MIRFAFLKDRVDFRVQVRVKKGKGSRGESWHWPRLGHRREEKWQTGDTLRRCGPQGTEAGRHGGGGCGAQRARPARMRKTRPGHGFLLLFSLPPIHLLTIFHICNRGFSFLRRQEGRNGGNWRSMPQMTSDQNQTDAMLSVPCQRTGTRGNRIPASGVRLSLHAWPSGVPSL